MAVIDNIAAPVVQACNEILNAGTQVYLKILEDCATEPPKDTITVDTTPIALTDETASLVSDNADGTFLRSGTVLHFTSGTISILNDVTVPNTPTAIDIQPAESAIAAAETAETFALLKLQSPTNVPFNIEATTVNRTDLDSFQGAMVKTKNEFKPQIQCIASLLDKALWDAVFVGANSAQDVYAVLVYGSTQLAVGRALISGYNVDGNIEEIQRPQFTLEFQGKDYRLTKPYSFASTADQAGINEVMRLAGLNEFS